MTINRCIDCGKEAKNVYAERCQECYYKWNVGLNNPNFGNGDKIRAELNGNWKGKKAVKRKIYYCKEKGCNNEICYETWKYGQGRCKSCRQLGKLNPKFGIKENVQIKEKRMKKIIKSLHQFPNKSEKLLNKLLQEILLKEYEYVESGDVILGGFNPDFININGQKKIIELYGDYWHNKPDYKERDKRRIKTYTKYGYKTLIIWEHELKDLELLASKIMEFGL